jgi:hypothetical protein
VGGGGGGEEAEGGCGARKKMGRGGAWRVGEDREEREREIDGKGINLRERRSKNNRSGV